MGHGWGVLVEKRIAAANLISVNKAKRGESMMLHHPAPPLVSLPPSTDILTWKGAPEYASYIVEPDIPRSSSTMTSIKGSRNLTSLASLP